MSDRDSNAEPSREAMIAGLLAASKQSLYSWESSVKDPDLYQRRVLQSLLLEYSRNEYGEQHGSNRIQSLEEFRKAFKRLYRGH